MTIEELSNEMAEDLEYEEEDDVDTSIEELLTEALDLLHDAATLCDFVSDLDIRKKLSKSTQKQMKALSDEIYAFMTECDPDREDDEEEDE